MIYEVAQKAVSQVVKCCIILRFLTKHEGASSLLFGTAPFQLHCSTSTNPGELLMNLQRLLNNHTPIMHLKETPKSTETPANSLRAIWCLHGHAYQKPCDCPTSGF